MAILRAPLSWRRKSAPRQWSLSLTDAERVHVRRVLRFLCARLGSIQAVANAMGTTVHMIDRATSRRSRPSAGLAIAVARLAEMPLESLLAGEPVPGPCPLCGRVTEGA